MSLPTAATVAARANANVNDPRVPLALAVALSWARTTLARDPGDTLADLNATGEEAILGAAADFLKLPAAQAALVTDNEVPATLPFDIGRRWENMLARGNKHLWAVR